MEYGQLIMILTRLTLGAVATFLAIVLWSNTRDAAWMFIVLGTILRYSEVMYSTLELFGIVETGIYTIAGIPVLRMAFENLPNLFFIVAFAIMITRNRIRVESLSSKIDVKKTKKKKKEKKKKEKREKVIKAPEEIPVEKISGAEETEEPGGPDASETSETPEEPEELE